MKYIISTIVFLFVAGFGMAQITTQTTYITFKSGEHNMFNPDNDPTPYVLNEGFSLPPNGISWNQSKSIGKNFSTPGFDLGPFGSFPGFTFGITGNMSTSGNFALDFKVKSDSTGTVDVTYPVKIDTKYPADLSFNYGDWVQLSTDYIIDETYDTAEIKTNYPKDLNVDLDMTAGVALHVGISANVSPLPAYNLNFIDQNYSIPKTNLLHIDDDTSYYWGSASIIATATPSNPNPLTNFIPGYPYGYPTVAFPACTGDIQTALSSGSCRTFQVWTPTLPVTPSAGPLSGKFTLPRINTTTQISNKNLVAKGDSLYLEIELDLLKLLGKIISKTCGKDAPFENPPKQPNATCVKVAAVLENLSNSFEQSVPGLKENLELWYNVVNTDFLTKVVNKQKFDFKPIVYGKFEMPTPVYFRVYNEAGVEYQNGSSNVINYTVGDSVMIKYPCFYSEFPVKRTYSIDGKFTSKTYDSTDFSIVMDGMGFGIKVPGFEIIPKYEWEICVPYGYPCGSAFWPSWCTGQICTSFETPWVGFPAININTCSFYPGSQPPPAGTCSFEFFNVSLGNLKNVWHEKTWSLEGFDPIYPADTIKLKGRQMLASATPNNIPCKGGTGTINVTITNGTAPYSVSWDNGPAMIVSATFTSPQFLAGTHVATITDVNGCQVTTGAYIIEPTLALTDITSKTDDSCNDAIGNGTLSTSGFGGTSGYSYSWNGLGALAGYTNTNANIANLQPGQYSLTVTDTNNCTSTSTYTIAQQLLLHDTVVVTQNVDCFNTLTGELDVTMTGGVLPYSYDWNSGGGPSLSNSSKLDTIGVGSYTLTVVDNLGCAFTNTYPVSEPTELMISTVPTPVDCFGNNTGAIDLTVSGGTPGSGYTYLWLNTNAQVMSQSTQDLTSLVQGTYTVQVTDSKGCFKEIITPVTQPDLIQVSSVVLDNIDCNGNSSGQIDITPIGGTGTYSFDWSNDGTSDFDDTEDLSLIPADVYNLVIRDTNMCTQNFMYILTQPDPLVGTDVITHVKCFGLTTGEVNATISGGTIPYAYDWSNDGTGDFDDLQDLQGLSSDTYFLQIKDSNDCLFNITSIVDQPLAPIAITETHADVLCHGGNTGSLDHTVTGGTAPYLYQWTNGGGITMTPTTEDLANLITDTYTFKVVDANLCVETLSTLVDQPALPLSITTSITDVDCFGMPTGEANVTVQGGTQPYLYDWSNDGTGDNDDPQDLLASVSGSFTLNIIDGNACELFTNHFIPQPAAALSANVQTNPVKCFGESTGAINLSPFGGTTPYTFDWDNDGTGDFDDTEDLIGLNSSVYNVTVLDAKGCSFLSGGFISQPAMPITVAETTVEPSCHGFADGTVNLTISGGTTAYYFQWGNQTQILLNNPSESIANLSQGNYFYRVTDANNCILEDSLLLNQPDTLNTAVDVQDVSCYEGSDGFIQLTSTGGTQPYTYLWSNSSTDEDQFNLVSGEYAFELLDVQNCKYEKTIFVDQATDILVEYNIQELTCTDQKDAAIQVYTTGGTPPYDWTWSNAAVTESIDGLIAGEYEVVIIDDNNCSKPFQFVILPTDNECITMVNAFTPNGDDYNDTWHIENLYLYPNAEIKIFNRWGNQVFESKGEYVEWDGYYKGSPLPADSYYYILVLNNGVDNRYTGTITIIR